jgi:AAA ATPase domain
MTEPLSSPETESDRQIDPAPIDKLNPTMADEHPTLSDSATVVAEVARESGPFGEFFPRYFAASQVAVHELKSIWAELEKTIEAALNSPTEFTPWSTLEELKASRVLLRTSFLEKPLTRVERTRLHRRVLLALETFDRNVTETVRSLPRTVEGSWQQFSDWLGLERKASVKPKTVKLRDTISSVLAKEDAVRSVQEDRFVHSVSECLSLIRSIWQTVSLAHSQPEPKLTLHTLQMRWKQIKTSAIAALNNLESYSSDLSKSLPMRIWKRLGRKPRFSEGLRARHFEHWEAQIRSGEGELRLERASEHAWDQIHRELESMRCSLDSEREELVSDLQCVADWLEQALEAGDFRDLPTTRARVVPAARRQQDLHELIDRAAGRLPTNLAFLAKKRAAPPARERWNQVYPGDSMRSAWEAVSPDSVEVFARCETENRTLLQEVERARDVVRFALELERAGEGRGGEAETAGGDALKNALDLLKFQLKEEPRRRQDLGHELVVVLPLLFCDYQQRTGTSRGRALAHIVGQSLRRGGRAAHRNFRTTASGIVRSGLRFVTKKSRDGLALIGFIEQEQTVSAVTKRTYLPEQFVRKQERNLPAIYGRLFRIEPVEDARFLVGRNPETQAITEALQLWERGRSVAVLLSGQRGSGKTSLLNCVQAEMAEIEVVRGEFSDRLSTSRQLDDFLRHLLDLESDADVKEALLERPRVVIIEELERTYLKAVGGFGAIQSLQNLIAATCHKTLWILAINQVAFRVLDRAVGLGQRFTHRIETASATRTHLETAIMVRHNLSGLRLRFASRHESTSRWRGLRRRLTGARSPRESFFTGLARQSTGVYRTALEMWLAHIETVEAGVVYIEPIALPDLGPIVSELETDDLFTLVAILQHGSLTLEEHSKVFACTAHTSQTQLEELIGRELLESDPNHPGLRIRPEAMPVVKEALYRRNLL